MSPRLRSLWSVLLVLSLSLPLAAQNPAAKAPAREKAAGPAPKVEGSGAEKVLTLQQQHALALLDQLFEKAKDFKDEQAKVKVQGQIADALWDYDEPRARRQFEDAFRAIEAIKAEKETPFAMTSPKTQLRHELLRLLSPRDPELVEKLVKSVPSTAAKTNSVFDLFTGSQSEQSSLLLELASELASTDPQRAAQMAQSSLKGGVSPMLLSVLGIIRTKEPALADGLFSQALVAAQRNTAQPTASLMWLASYVFPNFGNFMGISLQAPDRDTGATLPPPNPALIQQFLNFAYAAIMQPANAAPASATDAEGQQMAMARGTMDYMTAQQLLPFFDQHQPDKAALIRNRLNQLTNNLPDEARPMLENLFGASNRSNSVQDLLNRAEKETLPQQKDMFYMMAAMRASQDDADQALSIVEKMSTDMARSAIGSSIRFQAALGAASKGEVDAAYRYAKDLPSQSQRALIFSQLALKLLDNHDLARAIEVLNDAEKLIGKGEDGPEKARALVDIAAAMTRIDHLRGFEVMRTAVDAINRTNFDAPRPTGLGAMNPSAIMNTALGLDSLDFDKSLPELARKDFHRALLLAQAIEKKEISVPAQLAVCRGVLSKTSGQQAEEKDKPKETTKPKPPEQEKKPSTKKPEAVQKP